MAPANLWPVLFITLSLLYVLYNHSSSAKRSFVIGWFFGFGYFLFGLSWIGNALLVEGNDYKWAWPLAVMGLPVILAFFPACALGAGKKITNPRSIFGFLGFVSLYLIFEWLRGHIFTGFPWNLFGYTWAEILPIAQIVYPTDIYGLTWLTLLWASLGGFLLLRRDRPALILAGVVAGSFVLTYAYGAIRLAQNPDTFTDTNIRIVQANIAQEDKWNRNKLYENLEQHIRLSLPDEQTHTPTLIIWPETAIVDWLYEDPFVRKKITDMLKSYDGDAVLITGMLRHDVQSTNIYNSIVQINKSGLIEATYNKSHLVPFGEYIPFQKIIPLRTVTQFSGFNSGEGPTSINTLNNISYAPTVCYEIIFSGNVIDKTQKQPSFILTVTNDAWYGDSAGPYQHYTQALFRAIEEGVPVVRAANTGISGIISPSGHKLGKYELLQKHSEELLLPAQNHVSGK